jgi:hypothetical protein
MKPLLDRPYGRRETFTARPNPPDKGKRWGQPEEVIGSVSGRELRERYDRYFKFLHTWEGFMASTWGHPLSKNHYGVGTLMYRDWRRGWLWQNQGKPLEDLDE